MHGILQRQLIGILFEIICVLFQDSSLYRRISKHITRENLDLGVCANFYDLLMLRSAAYATVGLEIQATELSPVLHDLISYVDKVFDIFDICAI